MIHSTVTALARVVIGGICVFAIVAWLFAPRKED